MTEVAYHLLDVFTDVPFAGNQLAVCIDPPELSAAQMQQVAAELNLSETVFVTTPDDDGGPWPTRIFTPGSELPFAGHPTVGTAVLLAELGLVDRGVTLAEGVGDVSLTVDRTARVTTAEFTAPRLPHCTDTVDHEVLAEVLGLDVADLDPSARPGGWSSGVPFLVIPLRDVDALSRCSVDLDLWAREIAGTGADQLYPVAPVDPPRRWRVRMFAPGLGISEDPATGAAAAAVAGHLAARMRDGQRYEWILEQGVEMGRPSAIFVRATVERGEMTAVHVGGAAVRVGSGALAVPPA